MQKGYNMAFFDFIKRVFNKEKLDDGIEVSEGRAICYICEKKLDGEVYTIKGDTKYYCKKHAIETYNNYQEWKKENTDKTHIFKDTNKKDVEKDAKEWLEERKKQILSERDKEKPKELKKQKIENTHEYNGQHQSKDDKPQKIEEYYEDFYQPSKESIHQTKEEIKPKKKGYSGRCEYCGSKATGLDAYICRYCDKYHCSKHRLPENHKCTGNPNVLAKEDFISYSRS